MTFDSRLIDEVAIERPVAGAVDEYNDPTLTYDTVAVVRARIQPKVGRELLQLNEAGPGSGTHRVFMRPTDVGEADHLVRQDPAEIYQISFVAARSGAALHHLELECTRVWP